jgi:repressor LexA
VNTTTLTRRQQEILDFLKAQNTRFRHPPTLEELAEALGLRSRGSLHKHIQALINAGFIEPMNRLRRGVRLTNNAGPEDQTFGPDLTSLMLPLLGKIAAGQPLEAIEPSAATEHLAVPSNLSSKDNCYVLQVQGDSMMDDGILDGDWIIVEPRQQAINGQVVVAMVDGSEATVKRILQRPDSVVLIPANSTMEPMYYAPDRVQIQGIVVGQMRSYQ